MTDPWGLIVLMAWLMGALYFAPGIPQSSIVYAYRMVWAFLFVAVAYRLEKSELAPHGSIAPAIVAGFVSTSATAWLALIHHLVLRRRAQKRGIGIPRESPHRRGR